MFPLKQRKLTRGAVEHVKAGLGIAADYVANQSVLYAPFDGIVETYLGDEGGKWLTLKRPNGDILKHAHLDHYLVARGDVKEGDPIAVTGNTGKPRDGRTAYPPHLHLECYVNGIRVDPERYFTTKYRILYLSDTDDLGQAVEYCNGKLKEFSRGALEVEYAFKKIDKVNAKPGFDLDQFEAMKIVDSQAEPSVHGVILGYYGNNKVTSYATTVTNGGIEMSWGYKTWPSQVLLYELGHQLVRLYNRSRGTSPYIENIDNYKEENIEGAVKKKIESLMPYLSVFERKEGLRKMTKEEVRMLQILEGYSDEKGVSYWEGKPLAEYLKARLKDKVSTINQLLNV